MKRSISILCLSDIHYSPDGDMSVADSLFLEFSKYVDSNISNKKWSPDYILVAGDVAFQCGGYDKAKELIEILRSKKAFNIAPDHVIIVPGNHDKYTKNLSVKEMGSDKNAFGEYCRRCNPQKPKEIHDFCAAFEPRFSSFCEFNNYYSSNLHNNEYNCSKIINQSLRGLSGVRAFDDDHLCFFYINTEWLYYPDRDKAKVFLKGKDITDFVLVDEKCQLCSPLIKDACDLIKKKYKDYTIVTVMHRGFDHLSVKEKNMTDAQEIDAVNSILRVSDVIITGHDHVFKPAPPTLLRNKVQHFQLGVTGLQEFATREISRSAEIIRLNPSSEYVEQMIVEHRKDVDSGSYWNFIDTKKKYPLFLKNSLKREVISGKCHYNDTVLLSQGMTIYDFEKAIDTYFYTIPSEKIKKVSANENDLKHKLVTIIKENPNKNVHVVIYYDFNEYYRTKDVHEGHYSIVKRQLAEFRDENIAVLLNGNIVLSEVVIKYQLD